MITSPSKENSLLDLVYVHLLPIVFVVVDLHRISSLLYLAMQTPSSSLRLLGSFFAGLAGQHKGIIFEVSFNDRKHSHTNGFVGSVVVSLELGLRQNYSFNQLLLLFCGVEDPSNSVSSSRPFSCESCSSMFCLGYLRTRRMTCTSTL